MTLFSSVPAKTRAQARNLLWLACLSGLLLLTVLAYRPGLDGGFLFDDYPNLSQLGAQGGVVDRASARSFIFGGFS
ncbi:MAG: hypothetical protein LBQ81_03590, partial [Zoogloeaceae bacterium]|nr:hypothetical protein [Zoogloeaceae bacterium]